MWLHILALLLEEQTEVIRMGYFAVALEGSHCWMYHPGHAVKVANTRMNLNAVFDKFYFHSLLLNDIYLLCLWITKIT
jgi:hypothetical protein